MDSRTSLTADMWDEWASAAFETTSKVGEEITGIVEGLSEVAEHTGEMVYSSGRLWVFRRLRFLWPEWEYTRPFEFASLLNIPRSLKGRVFFRLPGPLVEAVRNHALLSRSARWLKGLWGSCGSLYLPKTGYYLCFHISSKQTEEKTVHLLKKKGFSPGRRRVHGKFEITLRNQQEIVDMLASFNMVKTTLLLEEKAIFRSLRNQANKLVNCDASNIRKSLEASSRQIEIARNALELSEYDDLPAVLKNLIASRLANPSMTLEELGHLQSPPVSKSTIKYRWKKISDQVMPLSQRRRGASKNTHSFSSTQQSKNEKLSAQS